MDISSTSSQIAVVQSPGKSAQSVGHQAKAAVAEAAANGIELPKNAQGVAASQIARGVEAAMVFQAPSEATAPGDAPPPDGPPPPQDGVAEDGNGEDAALALITAAAASYEESVDALSG